MDERFGKAFRIDWHRGAGIHPTRGAFFHVFAQGVGPHCDDWNAFRIRVPASSDGFGHLMPPDVWHPEIPQNQIIGFRVRRFSCGES